MCISHFSTFFSFLAIFQVLQCVYLIFHDFQCFLPYSRSYQLIFSISELSFFLTYSRSYSVHFSFFTFFTVSCHIPGPTVCVSFSTFLSFLAIFQDLQCVFLIFLVFRCFSPYSRSYSVCISFSTFFQFSCHNPGPTI